ncbi:MAG: radical SAM protein [Candidatus Aminicenantes bacterium]|nr:radical SAM protein [Candidatus Aminicenantes bacterium]
MTTLDYYRRLAKIFWSYKRKKAVLNYLPVRLWVEPTSFCNLACVMCPNKDLDRSQKGYMDFALFRKIIDEASRFVFDVHLLHRGESLLHPDFFRMVSYAHRAGIVTRFHTNGTLLDEEKSRQLLASGLDQFAFSFDGYDAETYERIRVKADFEKTVGNIIRFLEIKKETGARRPITILELIDFPGLFRGEGEKKRKAFLARFRGLPLDKIKIKKLHNWAGETESGRRAGSYIPCTFLWQALIIFWDGTVLPCTQDFHGLTAVGDVKKSSLADIWNGEKMRELRRRISVGNIKGLPVCEKCDRLWRPQFLGVPREYLWRFLLKKMN